MVRLFGDDNVIFRIECCKRIVIDSGTQCLGDSVGLFIKAVSDCTAKCCTKQCTDSGTLSFMVSFGIVSYRSTCQRTCQGTL